MSAPVSMRLRFACLVSLIGLSACALFKPREPITGEERPSIGDRDAAAILLAENNTDISYAQVASEPGRTTNTDVRAFANRMLNDHAGLNKAALDLYSDIGLVPRDHSISLGLIDISAAKRDTLRAFTGAAFDSAYLANEVRYHSRFLVVLDSLLIPSSRNSELKGMMTRIRPAVAAHLEHATRLQAGLGK